MNEETFVWRIWDISGGRWYRSSYRSFWPTEGGAKRTVRRMENRWSKWYRGKGEKREYKIVRFRLVEVPDEDVAVSQTAVAGCTSDSVD